MRNMLSVAMWNLHGKVCGKPCRNAEKRVPHRWNLAGLPRQATVRSYLSVKENTMRVIRRSPERKALVLHQRSAQLSPNSRKPNRKSRLYRRIDLGRNGLNRHPDSGKIVRRSRTSRRLWLQTASRTVRQNVRWCRTSRKHDIQCQRTGRRNLWCGVQTAENRKNHAQTAAFGEPR